MLKAKLLYWYIRLALALYIAKLRAMAILATMLCDFGLISYSTDIAIHYGLYHEAYLFRDKQIKIIRRFFQ